MGEYQIRALMILNFFRHNPEILNLVNTNAKLNEKYEKMIKK